MLDMASLACPLPEDILRCRYAGRFQEELARIELKLAQDIPPILRERLEGEKRFAEMLPGAYPYGRGEALEHLRSAIPDLTEAEFDALDLAGSMEFIYVEGEKRYLSSFRDTLLKTDAALRARAGLAPQRLDDLTRRAMDEMKAKGAVSALIRLRARLSVSDGAFRPGARMTVHLPLPRLCAQQSDIQVHSFTGSRMGAPESLQRAACFERYLSENEPFTLEYSYRSRVLRVPLYDMAEPSGPLAYPAERPVERDDLAEQAPHIVFTPYLRQLAERITQGAETPLDRARRIYDYITSHIRYMYMRPYFLIEDQAQYCALNGHGDCGIQALLFITLCRIAGIPARWQSGLAVDEKSAGCHDWAQFYIEPLGWLFCDPSYGVAAVRREDEEERRFYFGNLDPFRMVANGRYQTALSPEKQADRFDPYDNQSGEVEIDGRALGEDEFKTEYMTLQLRLED